MLKYLTIANDSDTLRFTVLQDKDGYSMPSLSNVKIKKNSKSQEFYICDNENWMLDEFIPRLRDIKTLVDLITFNEWCNTSYNIEYTFSASDIIDLIEIFEHAVSIGALYHSK